MIELFDWLYLGGFRWYRKFRGGNWKLVGPKYLPLECWVHNSEPLSFEIVWREENYG